MIERKQRNTGVFTCRRHPSSSLFALLLFLVHHLLDQGEQSMAVFHAWRSSEVVVSVSWFHLLMASCPGIPSSSAIYLSGASASPAWAENYRWRLILVSISPTFYAPLFRTKVLRQAFLYLNFRFELFLAQEYWRKCAHEMLVKLTTGRSTASRRAWWRGPCVRRPTVTRLC